MAKSDLFTLIDDGDADGVEAMLEKSKFKVNDINKAGYPPLAHAVQQRQHNIVSRLLAAGADPNGKTSSSAGTYQGYTPMHFAAKIDDTDLMQKLFEQGASPKLQGKDGWAPLHIACFNKSPYAIKWLVEKKADLNAMNEHRVTPILSLINHGKMDSLRYLIAAGATLEAKDVSGDTVMHHALHYSMHKLFQGSYKLPEIQVDVACLLALKGIDPSSTNRDGAIATEYIISEFGSDAFTKTLQLLYRNRASIVSTEGTVTENWNYMTILSIKNFQVWTDMGVPPQEAKDLVDYINKFETERKQRDEPKKREVKKRTAPLQTVGDSSSEEESDSEVELDTPPQKVVQKPAPVAKTTTVPIKATPTPTPTPTPTQNVLKTETKTPGVTVQKTPLADITTKPVTVTSAPLHTALPSVPVSVPVVKTVPQAVPQEVVVQKERVVEKIVDVKWQHPSSMPPPTFDASWAYHNRTAILCCIISFLLGNSLTFLRC